MNIRITRLKLLINFLAILLAWTFLASFLAKALVVEKPLGHADVILVLAGSSAYVERTHKAALIYKQGVAQRIVLTDDGGQAGWSQKEERNPSYVELAKRELVARGVPDDAIKILEPKVSGTLDEAKLVYKFALDNDWKSLLIVTSPYHSRRALRTFEGIFATNGLEANVGIVIAEQIRQDFFWWLASNGWRDVAGEYVKSLVYYWEMK